jgi:membrane fusion protein, copper/silver efflux system
MRKPMVIGLVALSLAAMAGYALYGLGMDRGMRMASSAAAPQASGAERRVLYWHDPMVPGARFDKPGKSPFMDMPLVPVYAEDADGAGDAVAIDPRIRQSLGIRVAAVTRRKLTQHLEAVGTVAYNDRETVLVQARSNGYIEKLHVRAPLDAVTPGQPLVDLYVPEWIAAQEDFLAVSRMGAAAPAGLLEAARQRMRVSGMTDGQVRRVEADGQLHPRVTVAAPIGGVVSELTAREGMTVMNGAPLFRINGIRTVWINAEVPESSASFVHAGVEVQVRTAAYPGVSFPAKVSALLPEVSTATRTLKARVEVDNRGGKLAPGMFATVTFNQGGSDESLVVPSEAVIRTGKRDLVMLLQGDGRYVPVEVEVGSEADGQTEIRRGVEVGDKVVASGQFLIDSEASLKGLEVRTGRNTGEGAR